MKTNARECTLKVWRFEYQYPPLRVVYNGKADAASFEDAVHQFRDAKPNGRILSIDGIRYDDGQALHAYGHRVTDVG